MSKRLSKKKLDQSFQKFLQESLSDDDSELQKRTATRLKAKPSREELPWWAKTQDDDEELTPTSSTGKSTGDRPSWLKPKPLQTQPETDHHSQPEAEPDQERDTLSGEKGDNTSSEKATAEPEPTPAISVDSLQTTATTTTSEQEDGTGGGEESEQDYSDEFEESDNEDDVSRETPSGVLNKAGSDRGTPPPGIDTLDEAAEKEKFFKELEEKEGTEHIDYAQLNKEVDAEGVATHKLPPLPPSDKAAESQEKKPALLAKVALLDSMESTLGTAKLLAHTPATPTTPGTGSAAGRELLNAGTGTELEALQKALYQAGGMTSTTGLEGSGVRKTGTQPVPDTPPINNPGQPHGFDLSPAHADQHGFDLSPVRPDQHGFDLSPIRRDQHGFDLSPVRPDQHGFDLSPVHPVPAESTSVPPQVFKLDPVPPSAKSKLPRPSSSKEGGREAGPSGPWASGHSHRYKEVKSSGYGKIVKPQPKPPPKRQQQPGTPPTSQKQQRQSKQQQQQSPSVWSPAQTTRLKIAGGIAGPAAKESVPDSDNPQLYDSVHSFASYIQQHFTPTSSLQAANADDSQDSPVQPTEASRLISREKVLMSGIEDWKNRWLLEHQENLKLKADLLSIQREWEQKMETLRLKFEQDNFRLKQENYALNARLAHQELGGKELKDALKRSVTGEGKEQLKLMESEVKQQEVLIQGYQQENERLYEELKKIKVSTKESEKMLIVENQKMKTELANLREQRPDYTAGAPSGQRAGASTAVLGAGKIAELEVRLKDSQVREMELGQKVRHLEQTKGELQAHIELMVREKNSDTRLTKDQHHQQHLRIEDLKDKYEERIEELEKRLHWYAENQQLLEKDAIVIKKKNQEIKLMKAKIEEMQTESNHKNREAQGRLQQRSADARKIRDLQRQVNEMEKIMRGRNPNSLSALVYAASVAPSPDKHRPPPSEGAKPKSLAFLEDRVARLEKELEERDDEAKMSIRSLEQTYAAVKIKYEERIKELERRLGGSGGAEGVAHLETELKRERRSHQQQVQQLQEQLETLRTALTATSSQGVSEVGPPVSQGALQTTIKSLGKHLKDKEEDLQDTRLKYSQLRQENEDLKKTITKFTKSSKGKKGGVNGLNGVQKEKVYEPDQFKGVHISDLVAQNQALKQQLEQAGLERDTWRVELQAKLARAEEVVRRVEEEGAGRQRALQQEHRQQLERLAAHYSSQHSQSHQAQQASQLHSQQAMLKQLKQQLAAAREEAQQLAATRDSQRALQSQVDQLTHDLKMAKKSHTPEMHHFESLQSKIERLEEQLSQRQQHLDTAVERAQSSVRQQHQAELQTLGRALSSKTLELQRFRTELDAILEVLRQLQQQGVVLPPYQRSALTS